MDKKISICIETNSVADENKPVSLQILKPLASCQFKIKQICGRYSPDFEILLYTLVYE